MSGVETLIKQQFIVAKTNITLTLQNLTPEEKTVVKSLKWFSIDKIKNSKEIIYPVGLDEYLSELFKKGGTQKPITIVLDRKPKIDKG